MKNDKIQLEYEIARICLNNMKINSNKKEKLKQLLYKLAQTDVDNYKEVQRIKEKMQKIIQKDEKNTIDLDSKKEIIAQEISNRFQKRNSYSLQSEIAKEIKIGSWGENFLYAVEKYQNERRNKKMQEEYEKRREEEKAQRERERAEERAKRIEERNKETTNIYTTPSSSIYTSPKTTSNTQLKEIPKSELEKHLTEKVLADLQKKQYGTYTLEQEEKKAIREAVGYTHGDKVIKALEKGVTILDIKKSLEEYEQARKNPFKTSYYTPNIDDVLKAASYVVEMLPIELLSNNDTEKARLANKLTSVVSPDKYLKNYETIYRIYSNYYNELPLEKQEEIKNKLDKDISKMYPKLHLDKFQIPSPDYLTTLVNQRVSKEMIENKRTYGDAKSLDATIKILKATKYMTPEQVASIYNQMKHDEYIYTYNDGMDDMRRKAREEFHENLQFNFARAILAKEVDKKLTPQEEKEILEQICKEQFHEKAYPFLIDISYIQKRSQVMLSKKEETEMIFGLDKLKKTLTKAKTTYGQYAKYDELKVMISDREEEQEIAKGNAK